MNSRKLAWVVALSTSLTFHGVLFLLIQETTVKELPRPPIAVKLIAADRAGIDSAALKAEIPGAKAGEKAPTMEKEIRTQKKATQKFFKKPLKKPSEKQIKKTETVQFKKTRMAKEEQSSAKETEAGTPDGSPRRVNPAGGRREYALGENTRIGGIADANELRVIKKAAPEYPPFSRKCKEEGTVTLIITITDGSVANVYIETSSGHTRLDASAAKALKLWKFSCKGTIRARIPITFKLK